MFPTPQKHPTPRQQSDPLHTVTLKRLYYTRVQTDLLGGISDSPKTVQRNSEWERPRRSFELGVKLSENNTLNTAFFLVRILEFGLEGNHLHVLIERNLILASLDGHLARLIVSERPLPQRIVLSSFQDWFLTLRPPKYGLARLHRQTF